MRVAARHRLRRAAIAAAGLIGIASFGAAAEDTPVFRIEMRDGAIIPDRIEVPANRRIKIEIDNTGETPVEFESTELVRERAVAPKDTGSVVLRNLDPGEYVFFDDFHPGTKATIVAR